MKSITLNKALFIGSLLCLVLFAFTLILEQTDPVKPLLIIGFACLAIASYGSEKLKGFTYSLSILAAVSVSMSYPGYFIGVGEFKFKLLMASSDKNPEVLSANTSTRHSGHSDSQ